MWAVDRVPFTAWRRWRYEILFFFDLLLFVTFWTKQSYATFPVLFEEIIIGIDFGNFGSLTKLIVKLIRSWLFLARIKKLEKYILIYFLKHIASENLINNFSKFYNISGDQLSCIIELLGMPPQKLLDQSKRAKNFISSKGIFFITTFFFFK